MQFERLRKSHKKQIIIGAIAICVIGGALTFSLTRAKYEIANDLELAKGTINYKAYDFKIMAMYKSEDKTNYTEIEEMPSEGYTINESKSYCNMSNGNKDTTAILKTIDGNHSISKLKKNDKCFIYFDKIIPPITIDEIISTLNAETEAPDFSQTAVTDEGVYAVSDGMYGGTSYYWRGAATTNYVKFANFCWRIIRINGDKTIRLIYDGTTCHQNGESATDNKEDLNQAYNTNYDKSYYVGWTYAEGKQRPEEKNTAIDSNAKIKMEEWYNNNVGNNALNESKVTNGKFCNDRNIGEGYNWSSQSSSTFYYASSKRLQDDKQPTLNCNSGDLYLLKIGILMADEIIYAGGVSGKSNQSYYIYNNTNYWTMTPISWDSYGKGGAMFFVRNDGFLAGGILDNNFYLRPVINLRADITFSSGNGTLDNPYIVAD